MKFLMGVLVIRFVIALLDKKNKTENTITSINADAKHPAEYWMR
jgi:hypothetical protein